MIAGWAPWTAYINDSEDHCIFTCDVLRRGEKVLFDCFNSLWPSDTSDIIWWNRSGSAMAQAMACCLTAPKYHSWLIISEILWHSPEANFIRNAQDNYPWYEFGITELTHWGRVTHICVSKLTIIGSYNGLSPDRRQAIIWSNAGLLLIRPLGTNFSEILIEILTFSFKKMHLKVSSAKRWPLQPHPP